jgi:hypothetical protein
MIGSEPEEEDVSRVLSVWVMSNAECRSKYWSGFLRLRDNVLREGEEGKAKNASRALTDYSEDVMEKACIAREAPAGLLMSGTGFNCAWQARGARV